MYEVRSVNEEEIKSGGILSFLPTNAIMCVAVGDPDNIQILENEFKKIREDEEKEKKKEEEKEKKKEEEEEEEECFIYNKINFFRSEPFFMDSVAVGIDKAQSLSFLFHKLGFFFILFIFFFI
jgi:hydroxymethylpyrimidine pyrophosphatase-like HAD family hydrolase